MIKKIIITLICIFALPIIVHADMGMPESYHYDVIITNPNGVEIEGYNGKKITIPYDTKVTVQFEYEENGELILDVTYNDVYGQINSKDVKVYTTEIDFSKLSKNTSGTQLYTIESVEIYKGPSTIYGKAGKTIPKGTTVDYEYSGEQWTYVNYKGTKGWIYTYPFDGFSTTKMKSGVVTVAKPGKKVLVLKNNVKLYADHRQQKLEGEIEPGEYDIKYYSPSNPKSEGYYIETDKIKGWLFVEEVYGEPLVSNVVVSSNIKLMHKSDKALPLYKNLNDKEPLKLTVEKNTILDATYDVITEVSPSSNNDWDAKFNQAFLISYNGKKYWIKGDSQLFLTAEVKGIYHLKEDLTIYDGVQSTNAVTTIKAGSKIDSIFEDYAGKKFWSYIEFEDYKGWAQSDTIKYSKQDFEYFDTTVEEPTEDEEEKPEKEEDKKGLTGLQIGLICGGAAIVVALTAIVTLVLVNSKKKNKNKKEESTTEPKTEEPKEKATENKDK